MERHHFAVSDGTGGSVANSSNKLRVTWWDRFLTGLAPRWGLQRIQSRAAVAAMARHYEAAQGGHRTSGWYRSGSDANTANASSIPALRELSRDLRRNNGWARRGIQTIANNTVGWGIQPKATGVDPKLAKQAIELWNEWADSSRCDYDGRLPFYGLQRLVMDTVVESGEALVIRETARTTDGLPIPVRIRVLEPDYLDTSKDGVNGPSGGPIVQGIEFDGRGRRVAYWLYRYHPGGTRISTSRFESQRIPATGVLHVYQVERPGQMRGVPWLSSAIAKLNDYDDYDDAVLVQQKIAASFAAFVQDYDGAASPIGQPDSKDEKLETFGPGQVLYLPRGEAGTT